MKKKKMQNVNSKSIEKFLEFLPDDELKMVELVRKIILNCLPDIAEKLSYNIPFIRGIETYFSSGLHLFYGARKRPIKE